MPDRLFWWTRRDLLGTLGATVLTAALPRGARADQAVERGTEIAREFDRRQEGYGDSRARMTMTLRNRNGQERTRNLEVLTIEVPDDAARSLVVFEDPPDVRGTVLLTHNHVEGADDQWMYLPVLGRVKRIVGAGRNGPFMGSEFSYADMSAPLFEKYDYRYLRDDTLDEHACYVIERYPHDSTSRYSKQVVWIDQTEYRARRVEYHDRKPAHVKTLDASDYRLHIDAFWRPHRLHMVNHQTGKSTVLAWSDVEYRTGLDEGLFRPEAIDTVSRRAGSG